MDRCQHQNCAIDHLRGGDVDGGLTECRFGTEFSLFIAQQLNLDDPGIGSDTDRILLTILQ